MDNNYTDTDTVDVTIEIDDDVAQGYLRQEKFLQCNPRWQLKHEPPSSPSRSPTMVCAGFISLERTEAMSLSRATQSIGRLSNEAIALLTSHLNMPSYGSLKNWDSVGIYLGMSDNEIMSLRQDARPMEAVLSRCQHQPAKQLIKALQQCKRIDILYSLKKLEKRGKLEKLIEPILLVHYEEDAGEQRDFRWLRKNLVQHASQRGFRITDIADLDIDANLTSTVEEAFAKAYQIVVSFTPSHIEAVKSRSPACRSVLYMHDLMSQEFFTLNSINKRFRPVIFNDTQPSDLPVGWPRSTLVYHFPTNMAALCTKIFKSNDLDKSSVTAS